MKPHKRYHKYRHSKTRKQKQRRKMFSRKLRQHGGISLKQIALGAAGLLGFAGTPGANAASPLSAPYPAQKPLISGPGSLVPTGAPLRSLSRFPEPRNRLQPPAFSVSVSDSGGLKSIIPSSKPFTLANAKIGEITISNVSLNNSLNNSIASNLEKIPEKVVELTPATTDLVNTISSDMSIAIDESDIKELSEAETPEQFETILTNNLNEMPVIQQNTKTYSEVISSTSPANIITIGGHNTLTHISQKFSEINIVSPNQRLTIDDILETCVESKSCLLDIDIEKNERFGTISSKHGGIIAGTLINASNGDTAIALTKVFTHAKEHPDVVYTIRIENNGNFGPAELIEILTPEQQNQLFSYSKNAPMPSFKDIQSSGKNIRIFMEKTENSLKSGLVKIDESTGIFQFKNGTSCNIMPQDHHILRTKWSKIEEIHKASISENMITNLESVLIPSFNLGSHFEIMIDAYQTSVGANINSLPNVANITSQINDVILPAIQQFARVKGKTPSSGALVMVDYFEREHAEIARNWNIINHNIDNEDVKQQLLQMNIQMLNAITTKYNEYLSDTGIIDILKKITSTQSIKFKNWKVFGSMTYKLIKHFIIPYCIWLMKKHLYDIEAKKILKILKNKTSMTIDKKVIFINDLLFCLTINDITSVYTTSISLILTLLWYKLYKRQPLPGANRRAWLNKFGLANKSIDILLRKLCPVELEPKLRKLVNDFAEEGTIHENDPTPPTA